MNLRPTKDRIVVEIIPSELLSLNIHIPDTANLMANNKLLKGRVINKGPKVGEKVDINDIVVFEQHYGVTADKEDKYRVLSVGCLLAIDQSNGTQPA